MSDTTQVLLIDGKPIGYFPPTSAENVTYEEGVSVKDALDGNWTLINSAVGLNTISFESVLNTARELLVVTEYSQGRFYKIIPYKTITRGYYDIYDGMYASSSNNANATWTVNNTTSVISLKSVFWGGTNVTADCTTLVYYR